MPTYRRKPLDILPVDVLAANAARLAAEVPTRPSPDPSELSFGGPAALDDIAAALPMRTRPAANLLPPEEAALPAPVSALTPEQSGADLVARAVEILHQDMAAGALAASAAPPFQAAFPAYSSESLLPTSGLPANIREAVDTLLRAVTQNQLSEGSGISPAVPSLAMPWSAAAPSLAEEQILLRPAQPVRTGEQTTLSFQLHNDSFRPVRFLLQKTDLTGKTTASIPQSAISIVPLELALDPDETVTVVLTIRIPTATPSGLYSGLITAAALPYLRGVLEVTVA